MKILFISVIVLTSICTRLFAQIDFNEDLLLHRYNISVNVKDGYNSNKINFISERFSVTPEKDYFNIDKPEKNFKENIYLNFNQKKKPKSIVLGTVMSALVPGAGEFYAESYTKAAIFFGVELLSWGTFAYFRVKGDNQTEDYQAYADQNWDVRRYARWLVDQQFTGSGGIDPSTPDLELLRQQIIYCESQNFSHTLPEYGSQQFYELIGKYQNFIGGWRDAENENGWVITRNNYQTYKTQMFVDYSIEREKANDFYDYAQLGVVAVILNHILSAADAAWTISIFNKELLLETGMKIKYYTSPVTGVGGNLPTLNFKVTF